jgi:hypothetical protein
VKTSLGATLTSTSLFPSSELVLNRHAVTSHAPRRKGHSTKLGTAEFSRASEKQSAVRHYIVNSQTVVILVFGNNIQGDL